MPQRAVGRGVSLPRRLSGPEALTGAAVSLKLNQSDGICASHCAGPIEIFIKDYLLNNLSQFYALFACFVFI